MVDRWIFRFYNLLVLVALPLIAVGVLLRWRRRIQGAEVLRWDERWGHPTESQKKAFAQGRWWWVHAVSVGEVKAIEAFLRKAPTHAGVQVLLTCVTPEALQWAQERQLANQIMAAPIDLPWIVRRVFRAVRPQVFVSVESEFWPNLLREARRSRAKVALINGRLSEHSFRSYLKVRRILGALWSCFDGLAVRQGQDAARFAELGVPKEKIKILGNLKYDLDVEGSDPIANTADSPVLVLGSTREGEEKELLPVIEKVREQWPGLQVIWAPRHVERAAEIETLLAGRAGSTERKSALVSAEGERRPVANVIWDSMGDLMEAYKQADLAVIGGSFVPKGGQNPIEPAALSRPVIFGPSMDNFHGIAEILVREGGARQVELTDLEGTLRELLSNPDSRRSMGQRARQAVETEQGATERTLRFLEDLKRV